MNVFALLGSFLEAAVGPLAKRVLVALGMGIISYATLDTVLEQAINYAKDAYLGMPNAVISLAGLAGFGEAFGIIAAAMTFRIAWVSQSKVLGVVSS